MVSPYEFRLCFISDCLLDKSGKSKIQKNEFFECWAPSNILFFNVHMTNVDAMDSFK